MFEKCVDKHRNMVYDSIVGRIIMAKKETKTNDKTLDQVLAEIEKQFGRIQ